MLSRRWPGTRARWCGCSGRRRSFSFSERATTPRLSWLTHSLPLRPSRHPRGDATSGPSRTGPGQRTPHFPRRGPPGERPPESPRLTIMKRVAVAALSVALMTLSACGSSTPPGSSAPPGSSTPPGSSRDIFAQRAKEVVTAWTEGDLLARWRTSFIAAQGLTIEPDWTPRGDLKASFGNGWVRSATALPTAGGTGEVRYAVDGTSVRVRTVGAQAAYDAMVNPRVGECPHAEDGSSACAWVTITGVHAGTATILSSRGGATVPTWEFTVKGLSTPLVRVAVADALEPEDLRPPLTTPPGDGRRILLYSQVVTATEGRTLTVALGSGRS